MRATKVKGAVICPVCSEIVDPEDHELPEPKETWACPACDAVSDEGPAETAWCTHEPPEAVMEQCPQCEAWVAAEPLKDRTQCPLCEEWFDPTEMDFDETEAWKCGECETVYQDRDEAKECCR